MPVDSYGVGSALIRGENDFTGDIVMTDGRPSAKVGRRFRDNPRLEARRLGLRPAPRRPAPASSRSGRSSATTCMPAAAKRSNAASASSV